MGRVSPRHTHTPPTVYPPSYTTTSMHILPWYPLRVTLPHTKPSADTWVCVPVHYIGCPTTTTAWLLTNNPILPHWFIASVACYPPPYYTISGQMGVPGSPSHTVSYHHHHPSVWLVPPWQDTAPPPITDQRTIDAHHGMGLCLPPLLPKPYIPPNHPILCPVSASLAGCQLNAAIWLVGAPETLGPAHPQNLYKASTKRRWVGVEGP